MQDPPLPRALPAILAEHPLPWRRAVDGGTVQVLDSTGAPVSLFTILDFITHVTARMHKPEPTTL